MHVIDVKTSYNILFGRPCVHGNKIISSFYYQFMKYLEGGVERKIIVNDKSFTEAGSHFTDVNFHLKNNAAKEKGVDDVTTIKCDDLAARKVLAIKKVNITKPLSTSNEGNIASLKKKPTHVLGKYHR